jgi:hypothetical protein
MEAEKRFFLKYESLIQRSNRILLPTQRNAVVFLRKLA